MLEATTLVEHSPYIGIFILLILEKLDYPSGRCDAYVKWILIARDKPLPTVIVVIAVSSD
jgi:hypothetical protein